MIVLISRNFWCLSVDKKLTSSFMLSLKYCKLIILGTLGMTGYEHPKLYYQLVKNCHVCLQAKNQLYPCFSGDIPKIYKLLILDSLGMLSLLVENIDVYLHAKNTLQDSFLSWDITFQRILPFDWPAAFRPIIPVILNHSFMVIRMHHENIS